MDQNIYHCVNYKGHMSQNKFTDSVLENEIRNTIVPSIFPALNEIHKELLAKYTVRLINITAMCFGFYDKMIYTEQLKQNNYQDIKWLIAHLLPFLNENNDIKLITSLNDVYIAKKKNVNINIDAPEYLYSNLQYGRCVRNNDDYIERQFTQKDLDDNFYLLLDTIKTMSHKMHANWTDILPYTLDTYKSSNLFSNTHEKIMQNLLGDWDPIEYGNLNKSDDDICDLLGEKALGLSMEDMYNTLSIDLYNGIKDIKWLIYDIRTTTHISPIILLLSTLFNLKQCLNGEYWDTISNDDKTEFTRTWKNIINIANIGSDITCDDLISSTDIGCNNSHIPNKSVLTMLKGIMFSFDRAYSIVHNAQQDKFQPYIAIKDATSDNAIDDDSDDDNDKYEDKMYEKIVKSLNSVGAQYIYEFFRQSLTALKTTWFGYKLLTRDKTDFIKEFKYVYMEENNNVPVTLKNIYNYSKSLCHYTENKKFTEFPQHWKSLSLPQKTEIINRLNVSFENIDISWFNITKEIQYIDLTKFVKIKSAKKVNIEIHKLIKKELASIFFEVLITKGVMTQFIPNKKKTNLEYVSRDDIWNLQQDVMNTSPNNPYWTSSYHYLTMMPYNAMKPFDTVNGQYNFFTFGSKKGQTWYTAYSYDWVAQIGFCHHFINNRITFITGATGVGKSTEIPKMFLYYAKAIDYMREPHIICTQPRKAPTENNAEYVAKCLGVPIFDRFGNDTDDYYIQMKHRDNDHIKNMRHSVLEYSTDGSFLLQVNDPILKKIWGKKYDTRNLYDIIMIDEAHEHKINMDLLLTLLKTSVGYNNSLRLVILSATMDEDEPRYRRYYRDINDNKKYPLNMWIKDNKIDRVNVDRRYHISPPGFGTRFKVDDIYKPGSSDIDVALDIIKTTTTGDILLFQSGTASINMIVAKLNEQLPGNVIALPYHSQLNKDQRKFIETISDTLKTLHMNKTDDFSKVTNFGMGGGRYTRAIIVATNAAEASITIGSLRYVIETGTQKVQIYDYKKHGKKLVEMPISESSRIQRRGRVGRKAVGKVYYLYEKGTMENNKIAYEISTADLTLPFFSKLKTNSNESQFLLESHDMNKWNVKLDLKNVSNKIKKMISNQYFLGNKHYDYYGNDAAYDYINYVNFPAYYETGFDSYDLMDENGTFYIVHPNELEIGRNICGKITKTLAPDVKFIKTHTYWGKCESVKIKSFWDTLERYLYIKKENESFVKTQIGKQFIELFETLKMDSHELFRTMMVGVATENIPILKLVSMYQIINMDVSVLCRPNGIDNKKDMKTMMTIYSNMTSDSELLATIIEEFDNLLIKLEIPDALYNDQYVKYLYGNTKYEFDRNDYKNLMGPKDEYNENVLKKTSTDGIKPLINEVTNELILIRFKKIEKNIGAITSWCNQRNLDVNVMIKYSNEFPKLRANILKNITNKYTSLINQTSHIFRTMKNITPKNKLTFALLFGFPFNMCTNIQGTDFYLSVFLPTLLNSYKISSLSPYKPIYNTFVHQYYLQKYVLFLNVNVETNMINCLHAIDPAIISLLPNANISSIMNIKRDDVDESITEFIAAQQKIYNDNPEKNAAAIGPNTQTAIINYTATINEIYKDLYNIKNNDNIVDKLINIQ